MGVILNGCAPPPPEKHGPKWGLFFALKQKCIAMYLQNIGNAVQYKYEYDKGDEVNDYEKCNYSYG
jgi:hypothetical protein